MSEMERKKEVKREVKEEQREEKPEKDIHEKVMGQGSKETTTQTTTQGVEQEKEETIETYEDLYQRFVVNLPTWVKAPWAYITPKLENQLQTWTENWTGLVLEYCRTTKTHIVNLEQLRVIHPFKNKTNNRGLSSQQMLFLAENLVERELGRWIEPKIRMRVFWLTEDELAMNLYNYMISTGKAIEYWTLLDLRKEGQVWSSLPIEELRRTCDILAEKNLLNWLDKEKTTLEFIIT